MKQILAYKYFLTSEAFEEWQKENHRDIVTVQGLPISMKGESNKEDSEIKADIQIGINVIYRKEVKTLEEAKEEIIEKAANALKGKQEFRDCISKCNFVSDNGRRKCTNCSVSYGI